MPLSIRLHASRTLLGVSLLCTGLALAGCADDGDVTAAGSPFSQALFKDYTDLATQAASAPVPESQDTSFFSDLFGSGASNPADPVVEAFHAKADQAAKGGEPDPEFAPADPMAQSLRARLITAIARGKDQFPDQAARAQADYDCWALDSGVPNLADQAHTCRTALDESLLALENAAHPAPPPAPAPIATVPVAAPAPAAPANYTVYFDFDSWTLTAEDLTVITSAINAARTGGQSHITVVGHTDTSGSAPYNQHLSVRRANVVVEAMVDMGARRQAIQASGVGETDLAVPTPDGVKEAKNRRGVITLLP